MINSEQIKLEFPIFKRYPDLVFLDNASTAQKPARVIEAMRDFYEGSNANVHRGVYRLAERADEAYENARRVCAGFIGAKAEEIVFVKNATEAANLVAYAYGEKVVKAGDNIVVTELEHHSNFLPWQQLALRKNAELRVVPIDSESGQLDMKVLEKLIDGRTRIVAVTQMSNVLGTRPDLAKINKIAHDSGAVVVVDAAQGIAHGGFDLKAINADFVLVTGHKIFGPMGSGFLYGRAELLDKAGAFMTGGGMVKEMTDNDNSIWLDAPAKFEAGTPDVAGMVGLAEAIKFIGQFSASEVREHEVELIKFARKELGKLPGIKLFGSGKDEDLSSILSFAVEKIHPHDIASILAEENICIRAGHHCSKPLMKALGQQATCRISVQIYNTKDDIEKMVKAMQKAFKIFN